ncbi:hypothetical protein CHS0354_012758 [Potamilus streckersoni]|uniref:COX assembly mitochondrial protein n=1 Tax=Potamilus streckersoni TaxID=2493646 RepID=A0AAE0VKN5_9BIVA|nr:hypothetical protein CHS0354_012758 [Potamilus streckersoni]
MKTTTMADKLNSGHEKDIYTVLPSNLAGGPHGLGDPDDKTLRKVETEISIPQKMKKKAKENCQEVVQAFEKCGKDSGLLLPFKCRPYAKALERCLLGWYENEDFKEKCKLEYLEERSEYRRTGIKQKTKRKESTML